MSEGNDITEMLKNKSFRFTDEELNKIIDAELGKAEEEQNSELIGLCRSLIDEGKEAQENVPVKKKKLSFRLISLIVTICVLLFALVPVFLNIQTNSPVSVTESTSAESLTEESTLPPTASQIEPVSDTTEPAAAPVTVDFTDVLDIPEKILFYHNGKPQTIPKGDVMCDEVIKEINKSTQNDRWGILKLAVEDGYIDKIKNKNLCIEIYYDETQTLGGLNGHTKDKYSFEKVLIILDGSDKNTIFFSKDGKYQHGPIKPYNSALSEEVLRDIFDE